MKIFISADIEGVSGILHRNECDKTNPEYKEFAEQMTLEVKSACEGAIEAGAEEIVIKDAHGTGRNIIHKLLPEKTKLIRGWGRHPYGMMQGIDETFDATIFIGYHSCATSAENPLAHTINGRLFHSIKINEILASEFLVNSYTSNLLGVPVVFLSGDYGLCNEGQKLNENLAVVPTIKGVGGSVIGNHPKTMADQIKKAVHLSLKNELEICKVTLPKSFKVEIEFKQHFNAYRNSFYPGMDQKNDTTVIFETENYFEVLRMLSFQS